MDAETIDLREGEKIRWQGRTGHFPLLEQDVRRLIVGKWIGTVGGGAAVMLLYLHEAPAENPVIVAGIFLSVFLLLLSPILEWMGLLGQRYWITDQRAILLTKEHAVCAMELQDIDHFYVVQRESGWNCLVLGSGPFDEAQAQLRWYGCHPKSLLHRGEAEGRPVGMVFYGVENADGALVCLSGDMKRTGRAGCGAAE